MKKPLVSPSFLKQKARQLKKEKRLRNIKGIFALKSKYPPAGPWGFLDESHTSTVMLRADRGTADSV